MKLLIMAWKNLWRSRSRTLITVSAVFFAVVLATLMGSLQEGTYQNMIDNVVKMYSGYIQVQDTAYWDNKSINNTLEYSDDLASEVRSVNEVTRTVPRLESFTLLSYGDNTKGGAIIGVDPEIEDRMTNLSHWLHEGEFLEKNDDGLLIAINLAKSLNVGIGDTLVLISQGYHGASAAGLFPVRGILKFAAPRLNNFGVYVTLDQAQEFFSASNRLTSLIVMVDDYHKVEKVQALLEKKLEGRYEVMSWDEMSPEIVQVIESDRMGGVIMKAILYIVIGFGILGTVIMMMAERGRELGVMIAVGMKRVKLIVVLLFETLFIGFLGVIAGFIGSIPIILALKKNPVPLPEKMAEMYEIYGFEPSLFFSADERIFYSQVFVVFLITLIVSLYPVISILRLRVVNALRA
ncbi:MAG: ABC transporter permease [Bacteroidota bacterium]